MTHHPLLPLSLAIFLLFSMHGLHAADPVAADSFPAIAAKSIIAIPEFQAIGKIPEDQKQLIERTIEGKIVETQAFVVLERAQLVQLMKEQHFQDISNLDLTDASLDLGNISINTDIPREKQVKAEQILLGSMGYLFNRLVISVRLVDLASKKNLFATTIYTRESDFFDDVTRLAREIANKASAAHYSVTPKQIEDAVKKSSWVEAKELLDAWDLKDNPANARIEEFRSQVIPKLYDDYVARAEDARSRRLFDQARDFINNALSLKSSEAAFQLRSRIAREESLYSQEQKEADQIQQRKAEEASRKRLDDLVADPFQDVETYFKELSPYANHFGASVSWLLDPSLAFPDHWGAWGVDYLGTFDVVGKRNRNTLEANSIGWLGLNVTYDDLQSPSTIGASAFLNPQLGVATKLAFLQIAMGLDVGGTVIFNSGIQEGYRAGLTLGGMAIGELRIVRNLGLWISARLQWQYWPVAGGTGDFAARLSAGLSF